MMEVAESNPRLLSREIPDGAGAEIRTRTLLRGEDFKFFNKGRRIKLYLIRRPFPFTRSTRSALQSEEYGHPRGHLELGALG
jgi:hypothetical protein